MPFADLGLSDPLLRAVAEAGYDEPTPIQKGTIPPVLMGKDIIGIAQTGTGKTAAFVLPMIDILGEGRSRARMPRSLILEPTRELAAQVAENFEKYGKYHKLSMALLIGGVQMGDQVKALEKGVDVLIATPGRLMDLYGRGKILLTGCNLLVIDEADRMLDMGFIPDIEEICSRLPKNRQTLLFSATMPPPIKKLADKFLSDPKMLEVSRPGQREPQHRAARDHDDQREETRRADRRAAPRGGQERDHLFEPQDDGARPCHQPKTLRLRGRPDPRRHGTGRAHRRVRPLQGTGPSASWSRATSPRAGSTSRASATSSISTCRGSPTTMSTASGGRGAAGMKGIAITLATKEDGDAVAAIEKLTNTKISRFSGDGSAEGAPATATPASEEAPREKRERTPRAKAAPKAAAAPKAEPTRKPDPAPERAPRAEEPRRDRAPRQDRTRREEPRREEPRYDREEEPASEPKLVADAVPEWNGPHAELPFRLGAG